MGVWMGGCLRRGMRVVVHGWVDGNTYRLGFALLCAWGCRISESR